LVQRGWLGCVDGECGELGSWWLGVDWSWYVGVGRKSWSVWVAVRWWGSGR